MIIFYRIPFVDFRNFLDIDPGKLELPFWPNPIPNKEFIKYGGQVFPRKKGGIAGWIGEMQLCNIKHAIKFQILAPFQDEKSCSDNIIKVAAKLFYHDGLSCCFIDFIFIIKDRSWANCDVPIDLLLNHIIKSRVKSRISTTEQITDYLGTSQITLEKYILFATTKSKQFADAKAIWIKSGQPLIFIYKTLADGFITPINAQKIYLFDNKQIALSHWWINRLKVVHLNSSESGEPDDNLRNFRIRFLRLHSEYECLKNLLHVYASENMMLPSDSSAFDRLQFYFNTATKKISRDKAALSSILPDYAFEDITKSSYEMINPGAHDGLMQQLQLLKTRRQVYQKIEEFKNGLSQTQNVYYMTTNIYGDGNLVNFSGEIYIEQLNQTFNKGLEKIENPSLKEDIESLKGMLQELIKEGTLNEPEVKQLDRDSKDFIDEVTSPKPRKKRLEVVLDGIAEFAKKSVKYVEPVAGLILKILTYF